MGVVDAMLPSSDVVVLLYVQRSEALETRPQERDPWVTTRSAIEDSWD